MKKFTTDVDFPLTTEQQEEQEEENQRATTVLNCIKCRDLYVESENKMGSCAHHDGFVYDNFAYDLNKYKPSEAIEQLNREEFLAFRDASRKEEIEKQNVELAVLQLEEHKFIER